MCWMNFYTQPSIPDIAGCHHPQSIIILKSTTNLKGEVVWYVNTVFILARLRIN